MYLGLPEKKVFIKIVFPIIMRHPLPMCSILPQGGQRKREEREEKGKAGKEERKRGNENTEQRGNKGKHFSSSCTLLRLAHSRRREREKIKPRKTRIFSVAAIRYVVREVECRRRA